MMREATPAAPTRTRKVAFCRARTRSSRSTIGRKVIRALASGVSRDRLSGAGDRRGFRIRRPPEPALALLVETGGDGVAESADEIAISPGAEEKINCQRDHD